MMVKSIAECSLPLEHSAILLTCIKQYFVLKTIFGLFESGRFRQVLLYQQIKKFLALRLSEVVFIKLINVKMPTIVGILTFISMINFMLS